MLEGISGGHLIYFLPLSKQGQLKVRFNFKAISLCSGSYPVKSLKMEILRLLWATSYNVWPLGRNINKNSYQNILRKDLKFFSQRLRMMFLDLAAHIVTSLRYGARFEDSSFRMDLMYLFIGIKPHLQSVALSSSWLETAVIVIWRRGVYHWLRGHWGWSGGWRRSLQETRYNKSSSLEFRDRDSRQQNSSVSKL